MTVLVACLSTGKGTWKAVYDLIEGENWEKILLVTNDFGKENFKGDAECIVVDVQKPLPELTKDIKQAFQSYTLGMEVALNLESGTGKEHMAILSALLNNGVGMRLVYAKEGVQVM